MFYQNFCMNTDYCAGVALFGVTGSRLKNCQTGKSVIIDMTSFITDFNIPHSRIPFETFYIQY